MIKILKKDPQYQILLKKIHAITQPAKGILKFYHTQNIPELQPNAYQYITALVYSLQQFQNQQHLINQSTNIVNGILYPIKQSQQPNINDIFQGLNKNTKDYISFVYLEIRLNQNNYISVIDKSIKLGRDLQCSGIVPIFGLYLQCGDMIVIQKIYNNVMIQMGRKKLFFEGLLIEIELLKLQQQQGIKNLSILRRCFSSLLQSIIIRVQQYKSKSIFNMFFVKNTKLNWLIQYSLDINERNINNIKKQDLELFGLEVIGIQ